MGFIPETFRKQNGVVRSSHPQVSWAAWGSHRDTIIKNHGWDYGCGENSPLARLYDVNAHILLMGINHSKNTSLHLAEYRASFDSKTVESQSSPVLVDQQRKWVHFEDIELSDEDFIEIGNAFSKSGLTKCSKIGDADSILITQRELVDFAVEWMTKNRS